MKYEFVKSHRKNPWTGVVLNREKRKYKGKPIGDLLQVVLVLDSHGNRVTRRMIQTLDEFWVTVIEPIDISWVNPNWLKLREEEMKR